MAHHLLLGLVLLAGFAHRINTPMPYGSNS